MSVCKFQITTPVGSVSSPTASSFLVGGGTSRDWKHLTTPSTNDMDWSTHPSLVKTAHHDDPTLESIVADPCVVCGDRASG